MRTTADSEIAPSIEQPKAVEQAASSSTRRGWDFSQAAMRATSAICSPVERFVLARLWPSLTETGTLMRCAPAA